LLIHNLRLLGDSYHYVTQGNLVNEQTGQVAPGLFALRQVALDEYLQRGQGTQWTQLLNLVLPQLIQARHVFKGLRRGLYNDDDPEADKANLIYTWKPDFDCEWEGGAGGRTVRRQAPHGAVFAVIASPNLKHREKYPDVDCFIGRWTWMEEDAVLAEAPVEWVDRYDRKLWTRSGT
jgi:hypothetical protein